MSPYNLYAALVGGMSLLLWLIGFTGPDSPRTGKIGSAILMFMALCWFSHLWSDQISRRNPYADDALKAICCVILTVLLIVLL